MAEDKPNQSWGLPWIILAGLVTFLVVGPSKPSGEQANPSSARTTKDAADKKPGGDKEVEEEYFGNDDALNPVHDFLWTRPEDKALTPKKFIEKMRPWKRDFLIALVPDPVDSHFGFAFDQLVDAVGRALEKDGYVFDRAWLPWELDRRRLNRTRKTKVEEYREEWPGMLLFRNGHSEPDGKVTLRMVFLVGENPTAGIDKRAFRQCLQYIADFSKTAKPAQVRIIGPYFSGSQHSLRTALNDWPQRDGLSFRVISGAASAFDQNEFLAPTRKAISPYMLVVTPNQPIAAAVTSNYLSTLPKANLVTFQATVVPSATVLDATLHYLATRDKSRSDDCHLKQKPDENIALFVETQTALGEHIAGHRGIVTLRFPLHISRLRAGYENERRNLNERLGLGALDSLVPVLGDTAGPQNDTIPAQDPLTTASTNGKALAGLLSTIAREKTRYVGILASDPRDKLFLASAIRDHSPGVQTFFIGAELLYSLPEFSYYLKGTVIGSTYPLLPENHRWTNGASNERLAFPSQSAQGYYNATLAQIDKPEFLVEYEAPRFPDQHCSLRRPPIWITMLGSNGDLVPLQYFTEYQDHGYVWQPPPSESGASVTDVTVPFPAAPVLALLGVCCFSCWVLYLALCNPSPQLFWWSLNPGPMVIQWKRILYRTVALFSLVLLLVPLAIVCWIYGQAGKPTVSIDFVGSLFLIGPLSLLIVLVLALFAPLVRAIAANRPWKESWTLGRFWSATIKTAGVQIAAIYLLFFLLFAGVVVWYYYSETRPPLTSWGALFLERALAFPSGVSPLLPLFFMCATFFCWAFFQLKRGHLADEYAVDNPYPDLPDRTNPYRRIRVLDGELKDELASTWRWIKNNLVEVVLLLAAAVILAWRLRDFYLPINEGNLWSWLFLGGFIGAYLLSAINLMRFLSLWARLKKLLHEISLVPMMRAFDQLPPRVSALFGGYLYTQRPRFSHLKLPLHQLGLLKDETDRVLSMLAHPNQPESPIPLRNLIAVSTQIAGLQKQFAEVMDNDDSNKDELPTQVRSRASALARRCITLLQTCWPRSNMIDAFGADPAKDRPSAPENAPPPGEGADPLQNWVRLAEGFVAIQVVIYVSQFFVQLRNLVWSMMVCSCLVLIAATSYPFQPERLLLVFLIGLIAAVVTGTMYVLVQVNRDELVSHISRTTPNRFTPDVGFLTSFCTYVLPTLGILALQLSGTFRFLIEPVLRVLR
jgi:hypothetical protein